MPNIFISNIEFSNEYVLKLNIHIKPYCFLEVYSKKIDIGKLLKEEEMKKSLWSLGKKIIFTLVVVVFGLVNSVFAEQIKYGDSVRIKNVRTGEYLTVVDDGIFGRKQPSEQSIFKIGAGSDESVNLMAPDGRYVGISDAIYVIYAARRYLLGVNNIRTQFSQFKISPSNNYGDVIELQVGDENVRMNVDIYTHPKGREVFFAGDDWRMTSLTKKWTKEFVFELVSKAPVISKPIVTPEPPKPVITPIPPRPVVTPEPSTPGPQTIELDIAISKNDLNKIRNLVEHGADVTKVDINYPISFGYLDIVKYLVEEKGLDIKKANVNEAIKNNKLEMVKYLVEHGADVKKANLNPFIVTNNLEILKYLVEHGADIKNADINYPISFGYLDMVKYLVEEKGLDIKKADLKITINNNNLEILKYLVEHGADIKETDLFEAIRNNKLEMLKLLVENGADVNAQYEGDSILWRAKHVLERNSPIIAYLKQHGAKLATKELLIDAIDRNDLNEVKNLLKKGFDIKNDDVNAAIRNNHLEILKVLVDHGAKPYDSDVVKYSSSEIVEYLQEIGTKISEQNLLFVYKRKLGADLSLAISWRSLKMIKELVSKGADVNEKWDISLDTPLHYAARINNFEMVKFFVEHGANVNATNGRSNESVLKHANKYSDKEIIDYLVQHGAKLSAGEQAALKP
jgi:ankyrin repeat protein